MVDPHKHGLQPYGCGAVLFADPAVGRIYKHESPYTYFTSERAAPRRDQPRVLARRRRRGGAVADAAGVPAEARTTGSGRCWPAVGGRPASWATLLADSKLLTLHLEPELDIVTFFASRGKLSEVDARSAAILSAGMSDPEDPTFLSVLNVESAAFAALHPELERDADAARVLRSVLMKPEHEQTVDALHQRVQALATRG